MLSIYAVALLGAVALIGVRLLRAREDLRGDLMAARHRISRDVRSGRLLEVSILAT